MNEHSIGVGRGVLHKRQNGERVTRSAVVRPHRIVVLQQRTDLIAFCARLAYLGSKMHLYYLLHGNI